MKSTQATVLQRVEQVLDLLLLGATLPDIRRYASEQEPPWGVSDRQLQRYAGQADALLRERHDEDRGRRFRRHAARLGSLYARAVGAADYRTALAVAREEAALFRLADWPGEGASSPPPVEGGGDVVRLLGERLREVAAAALPVGERARLTATLADAYLRAVGVAVLDGRLEALQAVLAPRGDKR